jgi:hypothetical protein
MGNGVLTYAADFNDKLPGPLHPAVYKYQTGEPPVMREISDWQYYLRDRQLTWKLSQQFGQKSAGVRKNIADAEVQVLALQEIHDIGPGERRNEILDKTFELLNEVNGNDWTYILLPKKDEEENFQLLGVAWNQKRVELVKPNDDGFLQHSLPDEVDGFNVLDRGLHAMKFRVRGTSRTDFVLIPVHMKSNRGSNTKTQRGIEAEIIIDQFLSNVRTTLKDEDVVILGDTNCLSDNEKGISNFVAAGFKDLNDEQGTFVTGAEFDRFLVPGQDEFDGLEMTVFRSLPGGDDNEHEAKLSDHFLVWIDMKVMDDDDHGEVSGGCTVASSDDLAILAVLPDPVGLDTENERVLIANTGSDSVNLDGWTLRDANGNELPLGGAISGNDVRAVKRAKNFSLNQSGDTVLLTDPNETIVDQVSYDASKVERGKFIVFEQ